MSRLWDGPVLRAGLVFALLAVVGTLAVHTLPDRNPGFVFWPSGLATVALVLLGHRNRAAGVVVTLVLTTASCLVCGTTSILTACVVGVAVALEAYVVSWVLEGGLDGRGRPCLTTSPEMVRFLLGAAVGALAAALVSSVGVLGDWTQVTSVLGATFATHLASQLLVVPLVAQVRTHPAMAGLIERVVQLALLIGISAIALSGMNVPLIAFTLIPVLGWGALRLSVRGALWQTAALAVAVGGRTTAGRGDFALLPSALGVTPGLQQVVASVFLIDCILVVLPLAILAATQIESAMEVANERDRLGSIVDGATGVAIIGCDCEGRINLFNPGAEAALGYRSEEVLGRRSMFLHGAAAVAAKAGELGVPPDYDHLLAALADPACAATEMGFRRKDGTERVHSMTLSPMRDEQGVLTGYVSTSEDITERVREVEAAQASLAIERAAVDRLREVDAVKDAFVSTISHELRTPITSILGYVEMLDEGAYGPLTPQQADALSRVSGNSSRLLDLIDDLLTLARVQQVSLRPSEKVFDLREVVTSGHDLVQSSSCRGRALSVSLELPPEPIHFQGDREMLERVVVNLVGNAVKFTTDGGRVGVCLAADGSDAVLRVSDTGIGIPAHERQHLFERFFRASTAQEAAIRGTGLGLSITRAIVEQHGGSVRLDDAVSVGAAFEVRLPRVS